MTNNPMDHSQLSVLYYVMETKRRRSPTCPSSTAWMPCLSNTNTLRSHRSSEPQLNENGGNGAQHHGRRQTLRSAGRRVLGLVPRASARRRHALVVGLVRPLYVALELHDGSLAAVRAPVMVQQT
ncbi:hypothetical protein LY76DRAFT_211732 [Colletotrichum caudatum]|nr:hypothetical protein LY76DRAFT_211732 [Colletotrichum caudatum]